MALDVISFVIGGQRLETSGIAVFERLVSAMNRKPGAALSADGHGRSLAA